MKDEDREYAESLLERPIDEVLREMKERQERRAAEAAKAAITGEEQDTFEMAVRYLRRSKFPLAADTIERLERDVIRGVAAEELLARAVDLIRDHGVQPCTDSRLRYTRARFLEEVARIFPKGLEA